MSDPLVTILIPAYNAAQYLKETLDSVVAQTYANIEIILLDDASTDETAAIAGAYSDRVRHVRNQTNLGQFANVEAGLVLAAGELIATFHADDVYDPVIVERLVSFLNDHPQCGAAFCLDVFVEADGREYDRLRLPPELEGVDVLTHDALADVLLRRRNVVLRTPGALVRASSYAAVGPFRTDFGICADLDMWLRIAQLGSVGLVHEHLFRYRHGHGNLSHQYNYFRVDPECFFAVMDAHLTTGNIEASEQALAAYEGQRAEDRLMNVLAHYARGARAESLAALREVELRRLTEGGPIRRTRRIVLWSALQVLCRLPQSAWVREVIRRRWYPLAPSVRS